MQIIKLWNFYFRFVIYKGFWKRKLTKLKNLDYRLSIEPSKNKFKKHDCIFSCRSVVSGLKKIRMNDLVRPSVFFQTGSYMYLRLINTVFDASGNINIIYDRNLNKRCHC